MKSFYSGEVPPNASKSYYWITTRLVRESGPWYSPPIDTPEKVSKILNEHLDLANADREMFVCLYLDRKNKLSQAQIVSIGGLHGALVHPREVFRAALLTNTASIILVHNHPSGDPTPSREDQNITSILVKAGEILGIEVLDHIIVGSNSHVSMKEQNLM